MRSKEVDQLNTFFVAAICRKTNSKHFFFSIVVPVIGEKKISLVYKALPCHILRSCFFELAGKQLTAVFTHGKKRPACKDPCCLCYIGLRVSSINTKGMQLHDLT